MNTFTVVFCAPAAAMEEWMRKPAEDRKGDEQKMMAEWQTWTAAHSAHIVGTGTALGTNMRVTKDGASVMKNDFMLFMTFQAESQEALTALLANHPHFGIPGGYIEVMPSRPM
jgi:hypothetical protein